MTSQTTHQPRQQVEVIPHGFAGGTTSTPAGGAGQPPPGPPFWGPGAVRGLASLS